MSHSTDLPAIGKLLLLGHGSVSRCTLPLILKHLPVKPSDVTLIDMIDYADVARWATDRGVKFRQAELTPANFGQIFAEHVGVGDLIVDLTWNLETLELVGSEGRAVIREACESLEFYPRYSNEVEIYEHLGGMGTFGETFQSRINAWVDDLRKKTPLNKIEAKAEDALKVQLAIEAAIKSWAESKAAVHA